MLTQSVNTLIVSQQWQHLPVLLPSFEFAECSTQTTIPFEGTLLWVMFYLYHNVQITLVAAVQYSYLVIDPL